MKLTSQPLVTILLASGFDVVKSGKYQLAEERIAGGGSVSLAT